MCEIMFRIKKPKTKIHKKSKTSSPASNENGQQEHETEDEKKKFSEYLAKLPDEEKQLYSDDNWTISDQGNLFVVLGLNWAWAFSSITVLIGSVSSQFLCNVHNDGFDLLCRHFLAVYFRRLLATSFCNRWLVRRLPTTKEKAGRWTI